MNTRAAYHTVRQYIRQNREWLANPEWCDQLEEGPNASEAPPEIQKEVDTLRAWAQRRAAGGWRRTSFVLLSVEDFGVRRTDRPERPFYGPCPPLSLHWRITERQ